MALPAVTPRSTRPGAKHTDASFFYSFMETGSGAARRQLDSSSGGKGGRECSEEEDKRETLFSFIFLYFFNREILRYMQCEPKYVAASKAASMVGGRRAEVCV